MGSARSSFFRPSLRVVTTLYFWWASKRKQGNLGKKFPANLEVCGQSFTKDICSYGSHEFISKRLHQNYISNQRNTFVVSTSKIGGLAHQKCTQSSSRRIGRKNEERAEAKSKSLYSTVLFLVFHLQNCCFFCLSVVSKPVFMKEKS